MSACTFHRSSEGPFSFNLTVNFRSLDDSATSRLFAYGSDSTREKQRKKGGGGQRCETLRLTIAQAESSLDGLVDGRRVHVADDRCAFGPVGVRHVSLQPASTTIVEHECGDNDDEQDGGATDCSCNDLDNIRG